VKESRNKAIKAYQKQQQSGIRARPGGLESDQVKC
jgi:hypothetical protein